MTYINGNGSFKCRINILWDNNLMDGYGEYYKNNDKIIGYYKKDLKHGKGTYYFMSYYKKMN